MQRRVGLLKPRTGVARVVNWVASVGAWPVVRSGGRSGGGEGCCSCRPWLLSYALLPSCCAAVAEGSGSAMGWM